MGAILMKKALLTGITGQDGSYLAEHLLDLEYEVHGIIRWNSGRHINNIDHLTNKVTLHCGDLTDTNSLDRIIADIKPDEIYNLGAQSSPSESFKQPFYTADVVALGAHRIFESVKTHCPTSKIYQASTSEMFGQSDPPQSEETKLDPTNPYGVSKLYAHQMARLYRKQGLFISCGILFNHESERRGIQFVTQKIAYGVACAVLGIKNSEALSEENEPIVKGGKLYLGNLDAVRDWGYSPDYVKAMHLILQQEKCDDFVVATGVGRTIREFCEIAYGQVGLNYQDHVGVNPKYFRPIETKPLIGNPEKLKREVGWEPTTSFEEMVSRMVQFQVNKLR